MINIYDDVVFGMSEMKDGNMDRRFGRKKEVLANRRIFFEKNGADLKKAIFMENMHGTEIAVVSNKDRGKIISCDVLLTKDRNLPLVFTPADCMPIYLWNRDYVGLVHAGRDGTIEKILIKAIWKMAELSHDFPINIYFGDCIGPCCYHFAHDFFRNEAGQMFPGIYVVGGGSRKSMVDLYVANLNQVTSLSSLGLKDGHFVLIYGSERQRFCTCCAKEGKNDYKYFSHVRARNEAEKRNFGLDGRNLAYIMQRRK